jgi:hypothetical protein
MRPSFFLGNARPLDGGPKEAAYRLPAHHLATHGVVVGMTGSGKTGLVTVLVEEAIRAAVPVLVIDVKGDLPNLLLGFPTFDPAALMPWVEASPENGGTIDEVAKRLAAQRQRGLEAFSIREPELVEYARRAHVRVVTPGADAGELLHVLSSLERRSSRWDTDIDGARSALSAAISLILRLLGRDSDPARSREHVLLSVVAEARLAAGQTAEIGALLADVVEPPFSSIGALSVDEFMSKRARRDLAAALNTLLASPSFASWRQGISLDVGAWMQPVAGRTPATIVSVAHLDDEERALVLGVLLEEVLSWVRGLPGTQSLRALIVFDETYGFLPPHPASPPTKRPLVALMKQARGTALVSSSPRRTRWTSTTARALQRRPVVPRQAADGRRPRACPRRSCERGRTRRDRRAAERCAQATAAAMVRRPRCAVRQQQPSAPAALGDLVPARADDASRDQARSIAVQNLRAYHEARKLPNPTPVGQVGLRQPRSSDARRRHRSPRRSCPHRNGPGPQA